MTHGARVATAGGGQPPDDHLGQRVAAIGTVLPTLATKADLAELRAEMRLENQRLESAILQQLTVMQATLHADARAMHASLFRWMVTTMLTMLVAFSAFFIGLGNLLVSRAPPLTSPQSPSAAPSARSSPVEPVLPLTHGSAESK